MTAVRHSSNYREYQRSMVALVERAREIDIGTFETAPTEVLSAELRPRTSDLLEQANALVRCVLEACEISDVVDAMSGASFELALDAAVEETTRSAISRVADVAFIAQVELRQRAARLATLSLHEATLLVVECDGALRRLTKALSAIDRAIARAAGSAPNLDYVSELELSLRVRRCYARFRRQVLAGGEEPETAEQIEKRLRRAGTEIAVIVGLPIYPALRLGDRAQLRSLQQRIMSWLKSPRREPASGLQIRSDVCGFAAMLADVNRRQELFEHDARVVLGALESLSAVTRVSERTFAELVTLEGRDDGVDALLAEGSRDARAWLAVLERVAAEVGRRAPSRRP